MFPHDIILSIFAKRYTIAKMLLLSYTGIYPEEQIINICCETPEIEIIVFFIDNIVPKINVHYKNDILIRDITRG